MSDQTTPPDFSPHTDHGRRASDMLCGEHSAEIMSLKQSEEDRKKENDARQREIGQIFALVRESSERVDDKIAKSTDNINVLAVSVTAMKSLQEQDHETVKEHGERLDGMRDYMMKNVGKDSANAEVKKTRQFNLQILVAILASIITYLATKIASIIPH